MCHRVNVWCSRIVPRGSKRPKRQGWITILSANPDCDKAKRRNGEKANGRKARRPLPLVEARVCQGCRISRSLTKNKKIKTKGGTNRHKPGTEGPKGVKSKANPHWSRCSPGELSGGEQDR